MGAPGAGGCSWGQEPLEAPLQAVPQLLQLSLGGWGGAVDPTLRAVLGGGVSPPQLGGAAVWGTHTGGGAKFQSGAFWGYNSIFTGFMLGCGSNAQLGCHQLCVQLQALAWDQVGASARRPQGPGAALHDRSCPNPAPEEDRAALMETQLPYHNEDSALPLL